MKNINNYYQELKNNGKQKHSVRGEAEDRSTLLGPHTFLGTPIHPKDKIMEHPQMIVLSNRDEPEESGGPHCTADQREKAH